MKRIFLLGILMAVLSAQVTWGDIPKTISYQGVLTDASGIPMNGNYDLTFSLYEVDTGGAALWTETQSVAVVNGVFNVILGSVNPLALDFGQQYWLGVTVGAGPEMTPRTKLTSSPYSLNARTVTDGAVTGAKIADGQVVRSVNGKTDDVTLAQGTNVTITTSGNTLTISSSFDGWRLTGNAGTSPPAKFLGTIDDQPLELRVFGARVLLLEPHVTSPNIIGGYSGNSVTSGVYGATISGGGSSGGANIVTDSYGTVSGGVGNQAGDNEGGTNDANYARVGGGQDNTASGSNATVGGGWNNTASGKYNTVGGGRHNSASGDSTTVGGGYQNTAGAEFTVIGGGRLNEASNQYATIGGGYFNAASGPYSTVPGGRGNTAESSYSFAAGRNAKAINQGCFVWGDSNDEEIASTGNNQFVVRAIGGTWLYSNTGRTRGVRVPAGESALDTVSNTGLELKANGSRILRLEHETYYFDEKTANVIAGYSGNSVGNAVGATIAGGGGTNNTNRATANFATVGGGRDNEASSAWATVCGGLSNTVSGQESSIVGGRDNLVSSSWATIGGGRYNQVTSSFGTIAGGGAQSEAYGNRVAGIGGAIGGGRSNLASGLYSAVPGGRSNEAGGDYSFAAGRRAKIHGDGSFMWADSTDADFSRSSSNRFYVRSSNGIFLYTSSDLSSGAYLATGGSSWNNLSDRASKRNIRQVDGRSILERLCQIPICQWSYRSQDPSIEHIGPTAQDFYAAFGVGIDDKHISTIDPDGVALAAIQGLYELVKEKDSKIASLEARLAALESIANE